MQISEKQKRQIKKIAQKYDLELLLLFGSRVNKRDREESDFDTAYASRKDLDLMDEAGLIVELASVLGSENIDLTDLKKSNPLLRYEISRNCELLYGTEENLFIFKAHTFKNYINHLPLFELEDFIIRKRQKLFAKTLYD